MSAWLNLTKKELRLGLPAFLLPVIAFIVALGIAMYMGNRHGFVWEAVAGVAVFATGIQVFYLVYYLLHSLQSEKRKLHLWLHTPMSGTQLLLAKVVAGIVAMVATMMITGTTLLLAISFLETDIQIPWSNVLDVAVVGGIHLFLLALDFAVWFMFFWMIFLLFNRKLGTVFSFISTFVLFVITSALYGQFMETGLYDTLTMWGQMDISKLLTDLFINIDSNGGEIMTETGQITLYFGYYVFEGIVALLLFFASCWMLDRKVEV
ncbi:hypothetical protein [Bacillus solitudinis]|uniref:hypothetical protein n=1 Tax=Bacillus solitudinis TaxID=2014074 RepID=UPI000C245097|nr:hypothetical protein [Bacillus solitudinis]